MQLTACQQLQRQTEQVFHIAQICYSQQLRSPAFTKFVCQFHRALGMLQRHVLIACTDSVCICCLAFLLMTLRCHPTTRAHHTSIGCY